MPVGFHGSWHIFLAFSTPVGAQGHFGCRYRVSLRGSLALSRDATEANILHVLEACYVSGVYFFIDIVSLFLCLKRYQLFWQSS